MASNAKKKCKLIKNHLGRGNFVLFSNLFNRFREHPVVSKLKQDSCHEVQARLYIKCFILTLFPFSFESKSNVKFSHKNFPLPTVSFPLITGHGIENVLLMKFEILGCALRHSLQPLTNQNIKNLDHQLSIIKISPLHSIR